MLFRTCLLMLLSAVGATAKPITLTFDVDTSRRGGSAAAESRTFPLGVNLTEKALHYSDGARQAFYDFNGMRRYHWTDQVREENSLYSVAGGRLGELQNRARLAASRLPQGETSFGEALLEHLFAMNLPGGTEAPTWAPAPEFKASYGDKLLAEASAEGQRLESDEARAYVRFLRYYVCAHPDILARLESSARVPSSLTIVQYAGEEERKLTFRFKSLQPLTDLPAVPPPGAPPAQERKLDRLLRQVNSATAEEFAQRNQATLNQAERDRIAGKFLQALLRYFDYILASGREMPPAYQKDPSQFERLADSRALLAALREKDAAKAASALQKLEKKAGTLAYVLQIFRAGLLTETESDKAGLDLYLQALEKQPLIVGAWKDVGDIFYRAYLAEEAWKCWDAALRLGRNHPMLEPIKELEAELRRDYPEFF